MRYARCGVPPGENFSDYPSGRFLGTGRLKIRPEISAKHLGAESARISRPKDSAQKSRQQLQVSPTITGSPDNKKLLAARGGQESSARCGAVEGELHRLKIVARILP